MRPVKVLYINHIPVIGGAANSLRFLVSSFEKSEVDPLVLTLPGPSMEAFRKVGVEARAIGPLSMFGSSIGLPFRGWRLLDLINIIWNLRSGAAIRRAIRDFRPDLVHVNERTLFHAAWVAKREGVPVVMHARNVADRDTRWVHRLCVRWMLRYTDAVIAIDGSVKHSIREIPHCRVIYNPGRIEVESRNVMQPAGSAKSSKALAGREGNLQPVPKVGRSSGPATDATVGIESLGLKRVTRFLYLAILRDFKGIWDFLEAARLLKEREDVEFVVAGGNSRPPEFYQTTLAKIVGRFGFAPDVEKQVRDYVRVNGLEDNVRLLGHVTDVEAVMAQADVNVFPSWLNGPSRSIFECGMRGVPSILALRDRVEDVVEHERTGLIVPERDATALADAIVRLAEDPQFRQNLGENARRKYAAQFEPRRIASQVLEVYREIAR